MTSRDGLLACQLMGFARRSLGEVAAPCPYQPATPQFLMWWHGWRLGAAASKRNVPRETVSPPSAPPPGAPWSLAEITVLRVLTGFYSAPDIGRIVGRSAQSVRNRLARLKKGGGG